MSRALGIPDSASTVTLTAFDVVDDPSSIIIPAATFITPILPGHENMPAPIFAFLIENAATKQRVMFDLGPRKDPENAVPAIAAAAKAKHMFFPVSRDITEQLVDAGVPLDSINAVIWSEPPPKLTCIQVNDTVAVHFDHTGDMSKFPTSTDLAFGEDTATETYPTNPKSTLLDSDFAGRKLVPVDFTKSQLEIGGLRAHDYFGDGSFYLLDVPGHISGHVAGLARVTPNGFILLGGDSSFPCPGDLLAATRTSVSATHFCTSESTGPFDLAARTMPLLDISGHAGFEDPPAARASIKKLAAFDASADVFVVLAHDMSLVPVVGPFPALLSEWQVKGWKERVTWAFVDERNPAFRFSMIA
ncbi:hypothetical protein DFH07DRAFT_1012068 [Mycena maculata]|uniref:Metallo-beta-lactamase domain-containing protein n=1 Tax=Mycena maculata TaxID=230809 RepID=A0AAD7NMC0_9AGAR|nr:hypothetical protein DFH07DRAFT_1012068 [Mycena maculata]